MYKIYTFLICLLPLLTINGFLHGQEDYIIDIQYFNADNGLSHRHVNTVFHDSQGFIWVGTRYGLNRFDGHSFQIFSKEKNGLESNEVEHIYEDSEGWLWVIAEVKEGRVNYLSFVNTKSGEVKNIEERFGDNTPFKIGDYSGITTDSKGSIYISIGNEIWKHSNSQFKKIGSSDKDLVVIGYTKKDRLLGYRKISSEILEPFEFDTAFQFLDSKIPVNTFTPLFGFGDDYGNTWLLEEHKVYLREPDNQKWDKKSLTQLLRTNQFNRSFNSRFYYQDSTKYWYKDDKYLYVFHPDKGILLDMGKQYPELVDSYILKILFDKLGNTWICTELGVFKVKLSKNPFNNFLNQSIEEYNLNTAFSSRGIAINNGQLWANSVSDRQYLVDLETKQRERISTPLIHIPDSEIQKSTILRPVLKLNENEFYAASRNLIKYEGENPTKICYWKKSAKEDMLWSIHKRKNTILAGTLDRGLAVVEEDSLTNFDQYNEYEDLARSSVYHFLKWDDENTLLASNSGIYILNSKKGIVQRFHFDGDSETYIPTDDIYHLHKDKIEESTLWAATGGGGILKIKIGRELQINEYEQFTIVDGLSNNVTYAIYEDSYNNLWVPSDYGLIQFNKIAKTSKAYTTYDGLPYNEFNRISHFKAKDGRLFFGTMNGITSFYPEKLLGINKRFNAPLRLTKFKQFDGDKNQLEDRTTDLIENNQVYFQPNDKFLTFGFALLEYKDAHQIKYSYQLKGQSDEWIYLNDNELRLSGLPYGDFTLNVRAQGVSGQFSSSKLAIPITVLKPFYLKNWFFSLSGFLLLLSIFFWNNYRTQALKRRQKELEQQVLERTATIAAQAEELRSLDAMKSRFFANISHELRTPLTLIMAPIHNVLNRNQLTNRDYTQLLLVKKNAKRLEKMVNQILDLTKLEKGKLELNLSTVVWYNFLRNLIANFESLANSKSIDLQFQYSGNDLLEVEIDQEKVEIILVNLLSNAFKYTPKEGKILLKATNHGEYLEVLISDNGRGILPKDLPNIFNRFYQSNEEAAEGGTGIGLALSKEFVQLMNGTITAESEIGKGASFTVKIPQKEIISQGKSEELELVINTIQANNDKKPSTAAKIPLIEMENRPTILLVEDNYDLSSFIESLLEHQYQIIKAENGQEAMDLINAQSTAKGKGNTHQIELIISDLMMPIMDGYQLLEQLKSNPNYTHIPVIMLTARATKDDKLKALRIGVDDYLTKPFVTEELEARIENLLKNATKRTEISNTAAANKQPLHKKEKPVKSEVIPKVIDKKWLERLEKTIQDRLDDVNLVVDDIADEMHLSRRQFYRRIRENTGLTANQYLKTTRLTQARTYLENRKYDSVKAIAYAVGFKDVVYFSRQFKKEFGKLPSEYFID